jgi:hypothetical protein
VVRAWRAVNCRLCYAEGWRAGVTLPHDRRRAEKNRQERKNIVPLDPYGPRKATATPDLKAARKGQCAACTQQRTVYSTRIHPEGRPWEDALLCSDCLRRLQQTQMWPLPPA